MSIKNAIEAIKEKLHNNVTLVAVSKTQSTSSIMEAYMAGQRVFGENKIQEMTEKWEQLPKDIQWHMIGHVQRNKVKFMAPYVSLIHGVDSFKLLKEINKQAEKNNRVISCLLQLHIAQETTKFGLSKDELFTILHAEETTQLSHIKIVGLMGMASFTSNTKQIEQEFLALQNSYTEAQKITNKNIAITVLSMGMSNDFQLATKYGSTLVRIGSAIFGKRMYKK